jgi:hypothetical protein
MVIRSANATAGQATTTELRTRPTTTRLVDGAATEQTCPLARSAVAFAVWCHAGQKQSNGAPFIQHPLQVARLLRDAGCSQSVVVAGLLHEVIDRAHVSVPELTARFGAEVASLVHAVSDHDCIDGYRRRKHRLREHIRAGSRDAALLFAADHIATVRELPRQLDRDRAHCDTTPRGQRARDRVEHYHQMHLEHCHESLRILQGVISQHPLVRRLAHELDTLPTLTFRRTANVQLHTTFPLLQLTDIP